MATTQRITRIRRQYNQWVANQTLEDFALRFTAKQARRWSSLRVGNTALGAISFLALEAIGGAVTLSYGFTNAALAIFVVAILLFLTGLPVSFYAAKYGVDIDLLSRGAGFGYIGSTITSLIYASFTFIFFAIEAVILSTALEMVFNIPLSIGYLISAVIVIPLVTHGITFISKFQIWTQPFWVVLHLLPFLYIGFSNFDVFSDWTNFNGDAQEAGASFNILLFGAASSVLFSLIAQIGEQVDFLRFMPVKTQENKWTWWWALITAGPGWIIVGAIKLMAGSFLAYYALQHFLPRELASEPSHMYLVAFQQVFSSPNVALAVMGIFVILSQVKINVTNSYAGSIAWSNFFSRLTHSHPGRVVWLVFNVVIALLLMEMGIYRALEQILGIYALVAVAWVGALVADLVINKPLGLSPPHIEFKRAHLYDINPVGVGAMVLATTFSMISFSGFLGVEAHALSSFIALGTAFVTSPLIAFVTKGKYYIARPHHQYDSDVKTDKCCICEHTFEIEDLATCPAYAGPICSLCCSLDAQCNDMCKTNARFGDQILSALKAILPQRAYGWANTQISNYIGLHFLIGTVLASILLLLYFQSTLDAEVPKEVISSILWQAFVILMIVSGVVSWLLVLARESRRVAQEETSRQTARLHKEIEAHKHTDIALQHAKEVADAANIAKSRYVTGLAHELRTPLNAIFGYAQILEKDETIPPNRKNAISVIRRNSDHLAQLIEGIADISKIESGRIHLIRERVNMVEFLNQIENVFNLQAANAGIEFKLIRPLNLPHFVYTDEKRLRQVIFNLLTNAIKFTPNGTVTLKVRYRSDVAEFTIIDTGIGIAPENQERIFQPFERVTAPHSLNTQGIGLGLAICKILTELMGGEITLKSKPGRGSIFNIRLFLSEASTDVQELESGSRIIGYEGKPQTILIADDTPEHRGLLEDVLCPLGFQVYSVTDGINALRIIEDIEPDLYLLDVSMPEMDGWQLARILRKRFGENVPIMMISANNRNERIVASGVNDDHYLMKPVVVPVLLKQISTVLPIKWIYEDANIYENIEQDLPLSAPEKGTLSAHDLEELYRLGEIGHIRGITLKLKEIESASSDQPIDLTHLKTLIQRFEINKFMTLLEELKNAP
ncbi:MAG: response regulator [Methylocystaceae bacterium]|nr:response regulator [Methylocystaceae bacterium]